MKRTLKWLLFPVLVLILIYIHHPAMASVSVTMDGQLQHDQKYGGEVLCNTTDYLDINQDIELSSRFTKNTKTMNYVTGYRVVVNGQLYNQYQTKILDCRVPFDIWHSTMPDDTHVNVLVIVDTTVGKAMYDFQLEVNPESVKPLCEEHIFRFEVSDTENYTCRCCEEDPEYHYLESCFGKYVCTVCGAESEKGRFEFTEQTSPVKMPHVYALDNHCVAKGCSYEKTVPAVENLYLNIEADGRWTAGHEYNVEVVWEPEDIEIDDFVWGIEYTSIFSDNNHNLIEIVSSDGNHCVYRARENGQVFINVQSKKWNRAVAHSIEISDTFTDKEAFYRLLSRIPETESPMADPDVDQMLQSELLRITGNQNKVDQIANTIRNAPVLYQHLYLWSFFDYIIDDNPNPEIDGSYHTTGRMQVNTDALDVWFHESGHAVAYALNHQDITQSDKYKDRLYNAIYYSVYNIVAGEVLSQARGTDLTSDEKFAVIDNIMGVNYSFTVDTLFGCFIGSKAQMNGDYTAEQQSLFADSVNALSTRLYNHYDNTDSISAAMFGDMIAGCTNQVAMGNNSFSKPGGHGPLAHEAYDPNIYTKDYWYTEGGEPTYTQNAEGWAEFFSGRMTGRNNDENMEYFEGACTLMDEIAAELLDGYRNKHIQN